MRKIFTIATLWVVALIFGTLFAQNNGQRPSEQGEDEKRAIDFKFDLGGPVTPGDTVFFLVGNFAAQHNGAVITCDSAVRYSDRHVEFFGNVLINKNTTYIYGDRAEYNGDENEARVYSDLIKVVDGDATLYTYKFTFNTQTNVGEFAEGGVLTNRDNRLEAVRGYYYGDERNLIAVDEVQMQNNEYELTGDSVVYNIETDNAYFFTNTNIWNHKGNYLYADEGAYHQNDSMYVITQNGYLLTEEQEMWSDTIHYRRPTEHIILRGDLQLDDREHKVMAFGDYGEYWKHPGNVLLTCNPSVVSYDLSQGDTVYMRSDTIRLNTIYYADEQAQKQMESEHQNASNNLSQDGLSNDPSANHTSNQGGSTSSNRMNIGLDGQGHEEHALEKDLADQNNGQQTKNQAEENDKTQAEDDADEDDAQDKDNESDSTKLLSPKAQKALLKAKLKEEAQKQRLEKKKQKDAIRQQKLDTLAARRKAQNKIRLDQEKARQERLLEKRRKRVAEKLHKRRLKAQRKGQVFRLVDPKLIALNDSLSAVYLGESEREFKRFYDSLLVVLAQQDSLSRLQNDTTAQDSLYRVMKGYRNVRIFRKDFQAVCDSMTTLSTDSIIHFYIQPILWNENNQISSEQMDIYTKNQQLVRAEFIGEPLSAARIDSLHYNQIKGKTMVSHFRNNEVYRNDVNGNAQTIYFMEDGEPPVITGMATIESGDISFFIEKKQVVQIVYRVNPVWPIYPIDQVPEDVPMYLKGFKWQADRRPVLDSVFNRTIRPSQRLRKEHLPHPTFPIERRIEQYKQQLIERQEWIDRNDQVDPLTEEWMHDLGFEVGQPRESGTAF